MYINVASDKDAFNLSNLMKSGDWMVLYYAEWCGYCKTMKPEWKNVVEKLNNPQINTKNINTAEVESSHIGKLLNIAEKLINKDKQDIDSVSKKLNLPIENINNHLTKIKNKPTKKIKEPKKININEPYIPETDNNKLEEPVIEKKESKIILQYIAD